MVWLCVILGISLAVTLCILMIYKSQINKISRSLNFFRKHGSSMQITADVYYKEIKKLTEELNLLIDEQRKTENAYKQSDESLKTTITSLSHDIRTPLTSLDGYFQLLTESKTAEERDRYCKIIKNRIDSLRDMLEELFTYAKLQENSYALEKEKINISKLLFDTTFSFYEDFITAGTQPELNIIEKPIYIIGDESALERVFQNIIKNALHHGGKDVKVKMTEQKDKTEINISNSFSSNEEIDASMVFERFYKADKARSKTSTGLGLYIAKQLVTTMGGEISASANNNIFNIHISFKTVK